MYFAAFTGVGLPDEASRMWLLEPDIAYAFPNGEVTILSVMPTRDRLDEFRKDLRGKYLDFLRRLPDGPDLSGAEQVGELSGVLNYSCVSRRPAAPGLALIGDAAMTSDYLWGTGCSFAFQSAAWLVDATAGALVAARRPDRGLRRYAAAHRRVLAGHHRLMSRLRRWARAQPGGAADLRGRRPGPAVARHAIELRRAADERPAVPVPRGARSLRAGQPAAPHPRRGLIAARPRGEPSWPKGCR